MALKTIHKHTIIYGVSLAALALLLQWLQWRFVIVQHSYEIFIGVIALLFTMLGVWLALRLMKPAKETIVVEREVIITKEVPASSPAIVPAEKVLESTGISSRELEVLQLMARGMSNQEIAENLYVSLNTVKTHVSNIFIKLDVKRRTQAVEQARKTGLIE